MKFKPLLPSLKEKKRYLIFEIIGIKCSLEKIKIVILLNLHDFVGEYGLGLMGIIFLDDWQNNRGIIRVNNKYVDLLKASFVKIDKIDKELLKLISDKARLSLLEIAKKVCSDLNIKKNISLKANSQRQCRCRSCNQYNCSQ